MATTSLRTLVLSVIALSCFAKVVSAKPKKVELKPRAVPFLEVDPQSARLLLDNDFENGFADPWYDSSPSTSHWIVEDYSTPAEVNYSVPILPVGSKYLRAVRNAQLSPALLILRTATFTALPGDQISFSFWIRSKYTGGNTLELVLANSGVETTLLTLTGYSTSVNLEWRTISTPISISSATDVTLIFYSYCGGNAEDAVAIDDIILISNELAGSTTEKITTIPPTTKTMTSEPALDCPDFIENGTDRAPCWKLENKCYCFFNENKGVNWFWGSSFCANANMTLISLETAEEDKLIYDHHLATPELSRHHWYWTSGVIKSELSQWEWYTGPINYTNWIGGTPSNGDRIMLDFYKSFESGYWKPDAASTNFLSFICESVN